MAAHIPLPIAPKNFHRWLELFEETARETLPLDLAVMIHKKAESIAQGLKSGLFGREA